MLISTKLNLDLLEASHPAVLNAMQGDKNTRSIAVSLYSGGYPWTDTSGLTAAVAFKKPDGTSGIYDTLPDGTNAVTISQNTITAILAPQMLTSTGNVRAAIVLNDIDHRNQLSTFPFYVYVEANPAVEASPSENYYNYTSWEDLNNAADAWFSEQDDKVAAAITAAQEAAEGASGAAFSANQAAKAAELAAENTKEAIAKAEEAATNANNATAETIAAKNSFLETAGNALEEIRNAATSGIDGMAIVSDDRGEVITLNDSADWRLRGLKVFGKTTQNGNPTPDTPVPLESVGDSGSVTVTVCGKNLLTRQLFEDGGENSTGLSLLVREDGGLHIKGTAKKNANVGFLLSKALHQGEKVYIYYSGVDKQSIRMRGEDANGSSAYGTNPDVGMYTIKSLSNLDFFKATSFTIRVPSGTIVDTVVYMMVSQEPGEYEAPKEAQTLVVSTPGGLPGIDVGFGGTYDSDDLMSSWISDEVDFGSGQYIQRIGRIDSYSGEAIPREYMSTTGELSAGATVLYVLDKENPVPLTDGELAQYAALHTNYPNSTIFNDSGAGMEVRYAVDTKMYIDTKFAELAAAILRIDLSGYMKAADYPTEKWSFTLDDGSVVEKDVVTG